MDTIINQRDNSSLKQVLSNMPVIYKVPIFVALYCLFVTPFTLSDAYALHAVGFALLLLFLGLMAYRKQWSGSFFCALLLMVSLFDQVSYRYIIHHEGGVMSKSVPTEYRMVRPPRYQPMRGDGFADEYFQIMQPYVYKSALYAVTGSYLGKDFCPAFRQDIVSSGVRELFQLRQARRHISGFAADALNPTTDSSLHDALGCGTPKLRFLKSVQYASTDQAYASLIKTLDIQRTPVIRVDNPKPFEDTDSALNLSAPSHIGVQAFSANRVALHLNNTASQPRWLSYADAYNPRYWTATLDGNAIPIYNVNKAFKAVRIPPGEHNLQFVFNRNNTYFILFAGMMLSLAILFLAGVGYVLLGPRR